MEQINFKIVIEYDGTNFAGWQIQKKGVTVQAELERAISIILNQPIKLIGSGRTDAGVHAMGQVANFYAYTAISSENLLKALNSIIKTPIVIHSCDVVQLNFHARYSATSKEYHYHILNRQIPCAVGRDYVWQVRQELDVDAMRCCSKVLIGKHDFKSFEASGSPRSHTVREIFCASIESVENNGGRRVIFKIKGDGFLRFMVRNIVGTLVMAGLSKITPDDFKAILEAKNRAFAGATAPAKGLFLMRVNYD
ncbi:MAG: tRNA pseudouridine(38-40) synthase TruA [Desulfamplus sp.]|nr:tRNA pseudouridine(38-40) synthase TruA [Desulfamplus sp.]